MGNGGAGSGVYERGLGLRAGDGAEAFVGGVAVFVEDDGLCGGGGGWGFYGGRDFGSFGASAGNEGEENEPGHGGGAGDPARWHFNPRCRNVTEPGRDGWA